MRAMEVRSVSVRKERRATADRDMERESLDRSAGSESSKMWLMTDSVLFCHVNTLTIKHSYIVVFEAGQHKAITEIRQ